MAEEAARHLRVLLVDDQEGDLLLMRALLRAIPGWTCEMDWACTLAEAEAAVRQAPAHDVCLLDYRLGPCTGLDVRRELLALGCRAPMIILTGFGDPGVARRAMRSGAADYLEKLELTPAQLARAIEHALERDRLTRELQASEERYRALAAALPDACALVIDSDGRVDFAAGPLLRALAPGAAEHLGMPLADALPSALAAPLGERAAAALAGRSSSFELALGDLHLAASVAPFAGGRQALAVIHDATELTRARVVAAAAERMGELGALAAGMAHEFNNLNAIILGALERALAGVGPDASARRQLEVVRGGAERAAEVARSLLAFARGHGAALAQASLSAVVRETIALVRDVLTADGIALSVAIDDLGPMPLQPAAVGQVVMNLLLNARDALRGRPAPRIEVTCRAAGPHAVVVVADNGCGIARAELARVFEPFFSTKLELLDHEPTRARGGAGLGLSLCRTIVESHGGEIAVDSEPGAGSSFAVKLPLQAQAAPTVAVAPSADRQLPVADGQLSSGASVLVLEDEPTLRELWREVLAEDGWIVAEAATGEEALALLERGPFDVVLADLHLPGLSGVELIRRLRGCGPAVVAISGAELDGETALLVEAALAKPVELATIRGTLAGVLHRRRAAAIRGA